VLFAQFEDLFILADFNRQFFAPLVEVVQPAGFTEFDDFAIRFCLLLNCSFEIFVLRSITE